MLTFEDMVPAAIAVLAPAAAGHFAVFELADILVALGAGVAALAVGLAVPEFADIPVAAGPGIAALAVRLAVEEVAGVFLAARTRLLPGAVAPGLPGRGGTRRQAALGQGAMGCQQQQHDQ